MVGVMARTNTTTAATSARSEPTLADLLERLPAADRPLLLRLAGELGLQSRSRVTTTVATALEAAARHPDPTALFGLAALCRQAALVRFREPPWTGPAEIVEAGASAPEQPGHAPAEIVEAGASAPEQPGHAPAAASDLVGAGAAAAQALADSTGLPYGDAAALVVRRHLGVPEKYREQAAEAKRRSALVPVGDGANMRHLPAGERAVLEAAGWTEDQLDRYEADLAAEPDADPLSRFPTVAGGVAGVSRAEAERMLAEGSTIEHIEQYRRTLASTPAREVANLTRQGPTFEPFPANPAPAAAPDPEGSA